MLYTITRLPKKSGGYRVIYSPCDTLKERLKRELPRVAKLAREYDRFDVAHGFAPGRNVITNAMPHIGYRYSLSMDLSDFFDTVTRSTLTFAPREWTQDVEDGGLLADGAARQGFATSPALANIAAAPMDSQIVRKLGSGHAYTRYADDLTISANEMAASELAATITAIVEAHGFRVNPRKTHLLDGTRGRRIICGVAVSEYAVHPTRKTKRKLRAAKHNLAQSNTKTNRRKASGLAQWAACRVPKSQVNEDVQNQLIKAAGM